MIRYVRGDILKADVEALVNPVNCVGVMGKGLAFAFKELYPDNFAAYVLACQPAK
jgi:O-acetyl-ADP-ribose deacetylase (regulator of RNase III)